MRTLRKYCVGEDVAYLQYIIGLPVDGSFGPGTEAAVRLKQRQCNILPDGIVGPITQKKFGLSDFMVKIFDKSEVWFAGYPYSAPLKTPKILKQWAEEENADYVFNLAFFNTTGIGCDKYGVIKGRTLTYLKAKGYDVGYNSGSATVERIEINKDNICGGYKLSINAGKAMPVSIIGLRTRNANGILKDGRYFHVQGVTLTTERAMQAYMLSNYDVALMLIQDSGGSTSFYDRKKGVLLANEGKKENKNGRPVASVVCVKQKI